MYRRVPGKVCRKTSGHTIGNSRSRGLWSR